MSDRIWPPYTHLKTGADRLKVISGQGPWLTLDDGRQLLDCISSWWVTLHGHSEPRIAEAIYAQAKTLEQVIFAGFSHDPAEQLADRLLSKLPESLGHVFYSDNGSTAVEVALKMAVQVWQNRGEPRRSRFLAFEGAYHGDTFGTMATGARSLFTAAFEPMLFGVDFVPFPETWWGDAGIADREAAILHQIDHQLQAEDYAAVIIEPLIQGAGGMRVCRPSFLQELWRLTTAHNTLLIFDEVMTGFGRTGDWFACTGAAVTPDLICLSKGISGGFLPLAVTIASRDIYQSFYSDDPSHTLYHGHSFTANPIGCAAAIASWDLLVEHQVFRTLAAQHQSRLARLVDHPRVDRVRNLGSIAAFEVKNSDQTGYANPIGLQIRQMGLDRGLLLRPLGNVLYLLPPYCWGEAEFDRAYGGILDILDQLPAMG
jgi:adenosylmethionine---8-amino-7-oxononanoate aminotransferase